MAPAHADTAAKVPSNSAYFNASGIDKPDASPAQPPNVTSNEADGVGPGHLAVAAKAGTEDKVSFLYYDLFDLAPGTVIDKAVVSLVLLPTTKDDVSLEPAPEKVVACMAGDEGFSGDDGVGLVKAPKRLCDKFKVVGTASADKKSYDFDVTALANTWMTGVNEGVAFTRADAAPGSNFQVVFDKAETATLALSYTAPAVTTPPVTTVPDDTGLGTVGTPEINGGFAPTPQTDFPSVTGDVPTVTAPNPTVNQPPVAAPEQPATTNAAAVTPSMRPTTGFWLVGGFALLALALLSLVCGDTRVPAVQHSRSRLTQALATRQGSPSARVGFRALPS